MNNLKPDKFIEGIPYYLQIRETIKERINAGEYPVGEYLPSETSLASQFGVSRMTLRRAIDELVQEGLLSRKWGTGTMVASKKVIRDYTKLTSFHEDVALRGMEPSSKLIFKEIIKADNRDAEKLLINKGDEIFHALRLRMVENQIPMAVHELFIPLSVCPWITSLDLEKDSLYAAYDFHNLAIKWGSQIVEARLATPEQSKYLDIDVNSPVLYSDRLSFTQKNVLVERVIAVSPGKRFSLNLTLAR